MESGALELIGFLDADNELIRNEASELIVSLSSDEDFLANITSIGERLIKALVANVTSCGNRRTACNSAMALVNISSIETWASMMVSCQCVPKLFAGLGVATGDVTNWVCMALVNLTRSPEGIEYFISSPHEVFDTLCHQYMASECLSPNGPWESVESILVNISTTAMGRKTLLKSFAELLSLPLRNMYYQAKGVLRLVKHLCLDAELHAQLCAAPSNLIHELACIVYPKDELSRRVEARITEGSINGLKMPQLSENTRDADVDAFICENAAGPCNDAWVRQKVVECLTGLCTTSVGRSRLRELGIYEVMRVWHLIEESLEVRQLIENIVHLLHYSEEELRVQDNEALADH